MAEYIEREAAIDAICRDCIDTLCCGVCEDTDAIRRIPAADVRENTRGKCTDEARYFFCSECGYGVQDVFEGNYSDKNEVLLFERGKGWNFCPNCGAMVEES